MGKFTEKINKSIAKKGVADSSKNLTIRLPESTYKEFKKRCKDNKLKMNQVLREMITLYIED